MASSSKTDFAFYDLLRGFNENFSNKYTLIDRLKFHSSVEWCLGLASITFEVNFVLKFIKLEEIFKYDWGKVLCCHNRNNEED